MQQAAIGLSVILGFLSTELLGLGTGGLVSAGYLALFADQPYRLVSTLFLSLVVYLLTRLLSRFIIIYGSRRFMVTMLLSLIGTWTIGKMFYYLSAIPQDFRIIGYIVPGLVANDMLKQGVAKTFAMVLVITFIVRAVLMLGVFG